MPIENNQDFEQLSFDLSAPTNRSLVKYAPSVNAVTFTNFNSINFDIFFAVLSQVTDQHEETIRIDLASLRKITNRTKATQKRFVEEVKQTYKKLLTLQWQSVSDDGDFTAINFFSEFRIVMTSQTPYVEISVSEKAVHLVNDLSRWVAYSLTDFIEINSKYSKTIYRLLKQFKTTGIFTIKAQKFREILDVPKSYSSTKLRTRVLQPAVEELGSSFPNLTFTENRAHTQGRPITGYTFRWQVQRQALPHRSRKPQLRHVEPLPDWAKKNRTKPQPQKQREYTPEELRAKLKYLQELRAKQVEARKKDHH